MAPAFANRDSAALKTSRDRCEPRPAIANQQVRLARAFMPAVSTGQQEVTRDAD